MARHSKNGRPRQDGDRFPNGRLKPKVYAPNPKVVAQRRAMLGVEDGAAADLTMAENPLDLALARGWLTERRHRAARAYAALFRGLRLPDLKVSKDLTARSMAQPSAIERLFGAEDGLERSGAVLAIDVELEREVGQALKDLQAGKITDARYATILRGADKKHRSAKINWASVPAAEVTRIWDAVMASAPTSIGSGAEQQAVPAKLREIWAAVTAEEAREMFNVCVTGTWPHWVIARMNGETLHPGTRRRQQLLERGLDAAIKVMTPPKAEIADARDLGPIRVPQDPAEKRVIDRTSYVDGDGRQLYEVEKVARVDRA